MGELIAEGKLRGWGSCNDNAFGLTGMAYAARGVDAPPPCVMRGAFGSSTEGAWKKVLPRTEQSHSRERRLDGVQRTRGGVLTGKYRRVLAAVDNVRDQELAEELMANPRGRMDDYSWGRTLYRPHRAGASRRRRLRRHRGRGRNIAHRTRRRWCREKRFMRRRRSSATPPTRRARARPASTLALPPPAMTSRAPSTSCTCAIDYRYFRANDTAPSGAGAAKSANASTRARAALYSYSAACAPARAASHRGVPHTTTSRVSCAPRFRLRVDTSPDDAKTRPRARARPRRPLERSVERCARSSEGMGGASPSATAASAETSR